MDAKKTRRTKNSKALNMKLLLALLVILSVTFALAAQSGEPIRDYCAENIKTLQFHKKGFPISYPVLMAGDEEPLLFSFDELGASSKSYYYSIVLCNADWTESRISQMEYMQGMLSYPLLNYQTSFNTLVKYIHYELELPNSDVPLTLPGNYILKIFEDSNSDNPVITKRFVFADPKVDIGGQCRLPALPEFRETSQQIDFTIYNPDFPINNPYENLKVTVIKNFDWNTALTTLKPKFLRAGSLDYTYDQENLFIAGNEFRSFNINSRKYPSPEVLSFDYDGNKYIATLATDKPRNTYFFKEDIDGLFYVENKDVRNPDNDLESDYFLTRFSLNCDISPLEGKIFVYGGFNNFALNSANEMKYNEEKHMYECDILLKQGYYDYQYVYIPFKTNSFDESAIEGSFSSTENSYEILVYYRDFGSRYDKLIGYKRITKLK